MASFLANYVAASMAGNSSRNYSGFCPRFGRIWRYFDVGWKYSWTNSNYSYGNLFCCGIWGYEARFYLGFDYSQSGFEFANCC